MGFVGDSPRTTLTRDLDKVKRILQRARDDLEEARKRLFKHDDQIDEVALEQAKLVLQHNRCLRVLQQANLAVLEARTRQIEAASDLQVLQERSSGIARMLNEEKKKVEELDGQVKRGKVEGQRASQAFLKQLKKDDGETDEERKTLLIELANGKTMEGITEDIDTEKAKLELIHHADPGVLRDFEERARKIERAQEEIATRQASLSQLEEAIQELRERWEPALDDIIGRINDAFSYNFEQINCAGEVGVHKDEDFDKWAIEIKVKFRYGTSLMSPLVPPKRTSLTPLTVSERTRPSKYLTRIVNQAANVLYLRSSISCLSRPWLRHRSALSTRSTRVWTPAMNAWFMNAWWRLPATSTPRSTFSSRPSCLGD